MVIARNVAFARLSEARVHLIHDTYLVILIFDDCGEVDAMLYEAAKKQFIPEEACIIASAKAPILEHTTGSRTRSSSLLTLSG